MKTHGLPFSKLGYYGLTYDQKLETLVKEIENAFLYFHGVPKKLKVDNMKTAILCAMTSNTPLPSTNWCSCGQTSKDALRPSPLSASGSSWECPRGAHSWPGLHPLGA